MSKRRVTIGSLFSGSGGFELAGAMFGAVPVWASEILRLSVKFRRNCKHCDYI